MRTRYAAACCALDHARALRARWCHARRRHDMLKAAALHGSPGALLVSRRSHTGTSARHGKCEARAPRSPNDAHVRRPAPRPLSRRSTCRVRAATPRVHEA